MNERELFKKTFDAVPAPEYLAARAAARADTPTRRAPGRALRTAVLIVLAVALLSVCAVAVQMIKSKPDLITQCNLGLDTLRELGLFTAEFEVAADADVPDFEYDGHGERPQLPEERYEGVINLRGYDSAEKKYYYNMDVDTDTGKITGLLINAKPQRDWVPYYVAFWNDPAYSAMGFYDNYDAILDPELTLGRMCAAWAQYQGYERYELPIDAAEDVRFVDAHDLGAWNSGDTPSRGLTVPFYRGGKREPEYYSFNCDPAAAGPYFMIRPAEGPYEPGDETLYLQADHDPAEGDERSVVKLINDQLDELRTLGLLRSGLEVRWQDEHSEVDAGRVSEECTDKLYFIGSGHNNCNYCLCYNAGTGKLDSVSVCPKPGGARVADVYDAGYGTVMNKAMTIGEYCERWAEYQGYERWELPEGVDADTRYLDAHNLPVWKTGIYRPAADGGTGSYTEGLVISFFRPGSDEPEYAYVKYGPSDIGPCVTLGSKYLFEHAFPY